MTTTYFPISLKRESYLLQSLQVIGGSLLIALCAQISIPLPFSIVPLTMQTFSILLLAGVFGSRKSALMVMAYFAEILIGLPVLAGGLINPLAFLGPRGGYLLGFLVQAYTMGWLVERSKRSTKSIFLAGIFSCALQLSLGAFWLAQFVGGSTAVLMGVYPFIPGEILKVMLVSSYLKKCLGKL